MVLNDYCAPPSGSGPAPKGRPVGPDGPLTKAALATQCSLPPAVLSNCLRYSKDQVWVHENNEARG